MVSWLWLQCWNPTSSSSRARPQTLPRPLHWRHLERPCCLEDKGWLHYWPNANASTSSIIVSHPHAQANSTKNDVYLLSRRKQSILTAKRDPTGCECLWCLTLKQKGINTPKYRGEKVSGRDEEVHGQIEGKTGQEKVGGWTREEKLDETAGHFPPQHNQSHIESLYMSLNGTL